MKKSDSIFEDNNGNIKQEPLDHNEETKPKRSKWVRWLLNIFEFIVDLFT
jgi:hypothetical protein